MCHIRTTGEERTLLVRPKKVQRKLDNGDTLGECANSFKIVMCHLNAKKGTVRNILVGPAKVQKHLDHGDTQGECSIAD